MSAIRTRPITEPSAWTGPELSQSESWTARWTDAEQDEMEAIVLNARKWGPIPSDLAAFPLDICPPTPRLGERLAFIAQELEWGRGFLVMKGFPVDRYTEEEVTLLYYVLGTRLGTVVNQTRHKTLIAHIRDEGAIKTSRVRGYRTRSRLRYHTDSTHVVGLLCLYPAKSGGLSSLVSTMTVHNLLLARSPWYLGLLYHPWYFHRQGEEAPGTRPVYTTPIFSDYEGRVSCRYNSQNIREAAVLSGIPLSPVQDEALDVIDALMDSEACRLDMALERGDLQWVNNLMVGHSRTAFEDHDDPRLRRHLLRLWINMPNLRPLAPGFGVRYADDPAMSLGLGEVPISI